MKTGSIASWNEETEVGTIKINNSDEVLFFHVSDLKGFISERFIGRTVRFQVGLSQKGTRSAMNISIIRNARLKRIKFNLYSFLLLLTPCLIAVLCFMREFYIPIVFYVIAIPTTYFAYKIDRRRAKNGAWRIPESALHLLEFLGGWYGGFFAQKKLYHKTRKKNYQLIFWLIVITHQVVFLFYIWASAPSELIPQTKSSYVEEWEQNKNKPAVKNKTPRKQTNQNRNNKPKAKPKKKSWFDFY